MKLIKVLTWAMRARHTERRRLPRRTDEAVISLAIAPCNRCTSQ